MMDLWWSSEIFRKRIHWIGWEKLTLPKTLGEIGFKDLKCFNQALLAKQAWKIINDPMSLFSRLMKIRYFANGDFLQAATDTRPTYGWRSMMFGRELLAKGLRRIIGNGLKTLVWVDKWLYDGKQCRPGGRQSLMNIDLRVADLIDPTTGSWQHEYIALIQSQRPAIYRDDGFIWAHTKNWMYTFISAYEVSSRQKHSELYRQANQQLSTSPVVAKVWKVKMVPKIQLFL